MAEPVSLLERTRSLLAASKKDGFKLRDIAELSDGAVEFEWLKSFAQKRVDDPSVNRTEALHNCLLKLQKSKRKPS